MPIDNLMGADERSIDIYFYINQCTGCRYYALYGLHRPSEKHFRPTTPKKSPCVKKRPRCPTLESRIPYPPSSLPRLAAARRPLEIFLPWLRTTLINSLRAHAPDPTFSPPIELDRALPKFLTVSCLPSSL
jgi:hypothetical protein